MPDNRNNKGYYRPEQDRRPQGQNRPQQQENSTWLTPTVKETAKKAVKTAEKAVKTAAKATKAKKETVKKAVEAEIKDEVFVQFAGVEINVEAVVAAAKADYKAKGHRTPKTVSVYIKPEEGVAYYTVKGVGSEDYKVEL